MVSVGLNMRIVLIAIYLNGIYGANGSPSPLRVRIENGEIQGQMKLTENRMQYSAFQGIPFAQPPVAELRFEPPRPPKNWTHVLNATEDGPQCIQGLKEIRGSEDCLYLNVYTPRISLDDNKKYEVMVWIYGGAFLGGSSQFASSTPDYFVEQGVIVVALNYRLGIFGFLSTDDLVVPGNMGLKDQVMGLQWVRKNIARFGGDPEKVTIFGESAGGASVSILLQVRQARGLFRAAIMESGSSLCPFALSRNMRRMREEVGAILQISPANSRGFVAGLRMVDANLLQRLSLRLNINIFLLDNPMKGLPFSPVKEPPHADAIFTENSYELLSAGNFSQVPLIIGYNSFEFFVPVPVLFGAFADTYAVDETRLVPMDMNITDPSTLKEVGHKIREHYYGNQLPSTQNISILSYISDDQFYRPIRKAVQLKSKYSPVYFYKFSFRGVLGLGFPPNNLIPGVPHAAEVNYLWYQKNKQHTTEDDLTRQRMIKMWTNFAKFGNPTPNYDSLFNDVFWDKATEENNWSLLNIDKEIKMDNSYTVNLQFWENLYRDYGRPPYNTY